MGGAKPTTHKYKIRFETTNNDITYHISSIAMEGNGGGGGVNKKNLIKFSFFTKEGPSRENRKIVHRRINNMLQ